MNEKIINVHDCYMSCIMALCFAILLFVSPWLAEKLLHLVYTLSSHALAEELQLKQSLLFPLIEHLSNMRRVQLSTSTIVSRTENSMSVGILYQFFLSSANTELNACCCSTMRYTISYVDPHLVATSPINLCSGRLSNCRF